MWQISNLPRHSQEGGQVGGVRGDDDEAEQPPGGGDEPGISHTFFSDFQI